MKFVKTGVTRTVLITSKYTIKIPTFRHGWSLWLSGLQANLSEKIWSSYKDYAYLAPNPVLFSIPGGFMNIYRTAENISQFDIDYQTVDWSPWGDAKQEHMGYVDNKLVVLDYVMSPVCVRCK